MLENTASCLPKSEILLLEATYALSVIIIIIIIIIIIE
jgi:hypothetical protein